MENQDNVVSSPNAVQPSWALLMRHKIAWVGFGFGVGLAPKAPGTWGAFVGMMLSGLLLGMGLGKVGLFVFAVAAFAAGVWICNQTASALDCEHDYGGIVWDEIAAMFLIYALIPQGLFWWLAGFALFRVFDIVKPQPIALVDERVRGGLGVMLDDVIAAAYTILIIGILALIFN